MKKIDKLHELLRTPSAIRPVTKVLLIAWVVAAICGWLFVGPTVLRDSQIARDFVSLAVTVFPWLGNIEKLGYLAERGLFLHSLYFFSIAPVGIVVTLTILLRPPLENPPAESNFMSMAISSLSCIFLAALIVGLYYYNLGVGVYGLHRTGYFFAINWVTVPPVASFFIYGFWCFVTAGSYFFIFAIRKLLSTGGGRNV